MERKRKMLENNYCTQLKYELCIYEKMQIHKVHFDAHFPTLSETEKEN